MVRSLGLDVGTVTIGIAISDPLGMFAQPVRTLRRTGRKADVAEIVQLVGERAVANIVVGLPLRTDATEGDRRGLFAKGSGGSDGPAVYGNSPAVCSMPQSSL